MTNSSDNLSLRNGVLPNELYFEILDELELPIRIPSNLTVTSIFSYDSLGMDKVSTTFRKHLNNSYHPRKDRSVGVILNMREFFLNLDKTGELRERYAESSTILRPTKHPDIGQAFTDDPLNNIAELVLPTGKLPGEARYVSASISESYDTMRFINLMTKKTDEGTDWSNVFPKLEWITLDDRISSAPSDRPFYQSFSALFNQSTKVANSKPGCGLTVYAGTPDRTFEDVTGLVPPQKMVWKGQTFLTPHWRHNPTDSSIKHTIQLDLTSIFDDIQEQAYPAIIAQFDALCTRQYKAMSMVTSDNSSTQIRLRVDQANIKATNGMRLLQNDMHRMINDLNDADSARRFTLSIEDEMEDERYEIYAPL